MTKEEIDKYFIDKKIPLNLTVDNKEYYLCLHTGVDCTFGDHKSSIYKSYPEWNNSYLCTIWFYNKSNDDFLFKSDHKIKTIFSDHLIEFLYWFELNKYKCTNIKYYNE